MEINYRPTEEEELEALRRKIIDVQNHCHHKWREITALGDVWQTYFCIWCGARR